jgi:CubicO group peptidase (beta-lactamase class C family)
LAVPWFDLASLAKPLVTAPLALAKLDLDQDRREQLGFTDRTEPLTVRQLLSHSAGLPPWLPYTGEPLAGQLKRGFPAGAHPKLVPGTPGVSLYSDLGYRLLAELLEQETGRPFAGLGAESSGLAAAPWPSAPPFAPQGPDAEMWRLVEPGRPFPARDPYLPNDANARAGMRGHAGFAASPVSMRECLRRWLASGVPARMAVDTARGADGARWGLGLQRAMTGRGRFGDLLASIPAGVSGLRLMVQGHVPSLSPAAPPMAERPGEPSAFWFHLGFTGPALFFRPEDGLCLAILAHRVGPSGELLDAEQVRARRWQILAAEVAKLRG